MAGNRRRAWLLGLGLLCLAGAPVRSDAQSTAAPADSGVALPSWLSGSWTTVRGARTVEELWNEPRAGIMQGAGRTTQGDRLIEFEFLRIVQRSGSLVFIAQPNGRPPTEFALTAHGPDSVRFENPAHDFPKVVCYRRAGTDSLVAVVSASSAGKDRAVRFEYRRPASADRAR